MESVIVRFTPPMEHVQVRLMIPPRLQAELHPDGHILFTIIASALRGDFIEKMDDTSYPRALFRMRLLESLERIHMQDVLVLVESVPKCSTMNLSLLHLSTRHPLYMKCIDNNTCLLPARCGVRNEMRSL